MTSYFPRQTIAWKLEEPPAFRRLTLSLVEMAAITGVVLRLYRSLALTHGPNSALYFGGTLALGAVFLFGMVTVHLGNFTVRHWLWRAPAFALVEVAAEMLTSLLLIALHREPLGSGRAELSDWPAVAWRALESHLIAICLFALLLAGIVQLVRHALLRAEHREHTADAIHQEVERVRAEHHPPGA